MFTPMPTWARAIGVQHKRAVVWRIVVVAIGACRRDSYADRDLGRCSGGSDKKHGAHCGKNKSLHSNRVTLMPSKC